MEQALKEARSNAIKKSCTVNADFSNAVGNNGQNGGIIEIKDPDGTVLDSVILSHNIYLNTASSTIQDNKVFFDYRGEPVDSSGVIDNIETQITKSQ